MLEVLDFVRGAVAEKDLVPVLTHFHVWDGWVQGNNGRLCVTAWSEEFEGMRFTVPAEAFYRAVVGCEGKPNITLKEDKVRMSKGRFYVRLPLTDGAEFPHQDPDAGRGRRAPGLLDVFRALQPFMGEDASRPWVRSILLDGDVAFATNNVVMVAAPLQFKVPRLAVPAEAVGELLRLNYEVRDFTTSQNSITFRYEDESWVKTQLIAEGWPDRDTLEKMLPACGKKVPVGLLQAVQQVVPFCPEPKFPLIKLGENGVSTAEGDMSAAVTGYKLPEAVFRAEPLEQVLQVAKFADFGTYPAPCPFAGEHLRGVIVGVRT